MIALVALPTLVIYVVITGLTLGYLQRESREQVEAEMTRLARNYAARFDGYLREAAAIADATANFIQNEPDLDQEKIYAQLSDNVTQLPFIYGAAMAFEPGSYKPVGELFCPYVYRDGDGLARMDVAAEAYDYTDGNWPWWSRPAKTSQSFWTDPYFDDGAGNILMVTYSAPFFRDGQFRGVTTVDIAIPNLNETVGTHIVGDERFYVLAPDGTYVYSFNTANIGLDAFAAAEQINRPDIADLVREIVSGRAGTRVIQGTKGAQSEGSTMWVFFAPIESAGWGFASSLDQATVLAPVRKRTLVGSSALAVTLALIIASIWFVSGRIVSPIIHLRDKALEIAAGDLDVRIDNTSNADEIGDLARAFNQMTADLRANVKDLADEQAARQKIERDLDLAREIQRGLLPAGPPNVPGFEIAGWNQPADKTGGDFYDWLELPDGRTAVCLADVTGHGIGPALIVAVCRAYIRAATSAEPLDLAKAIARVNDMLHQDTPDDRFVTAAIGIIDHDKSSMEFISAGQGPIFFYDAARRTVESWDADVLPLGVIDGVDVARAREIQFRPGDIMLLTTDGFFEWMNAEGKQYGTERLAEFLRIHHHMNGENLIRALHAEVLAHADGTPQDDDLTAVVVKRTDQ